MLIGTPAKKAISIEDLTMPVFCQKTAIHIVFYEVLLSKKSAANGASAAYAGARRNDGSLPCFAECGEFELQFKTPLSLQAGVGGFNRFAHSAGPGV